MNTLVPNKDKERKRKWYEEHKQLSKDRTKAWVIEHPERRRQISKEYEARKYFGEDISLIKKNMCLLCSSEKDLAIHHKDGQNGRNGKPVNNNHNNFIVLCRSCHTSVHNRWGLKEIS